MSTPVPGPVLGPCEAWIDGDDVAALGCTAANSEQETLIENAAIEASMALFEISGRKFSGLCAETVRPCRDTCSCWGPASLGIGPWFWSSYAGGWGAGAWGWRNEAGDRLGCQPMSRVRLAGYPVREIVAVTIDGTELEPLDEDGNPNWRLDEWRFLTRLSKPAASGGAPTPRQWPACQNLSLDSTQPGTFEISYRYGVDPPQLGRDAAAALACQLFKSMIGQPCALPTGATKVQRQGVTVERGILTNWFDATKSTGIVPLDLFLRAYYERRTGRKSAVWSPDVQQFARPSGIDSSGT